MSARRFIVIVIIVILVGFFQKNTCIYFSVSQFQIEQIVCSYSFCNLWTTFWFSSSIEKVQDDIYVSAEDSYPTILP